MRKVIGFAGRFALAYGVTAFLWIAVLERPYNEYLAWASMRVLAVMEEPRLTTAVRREATHLIPEHVTHFSDIPPHLIATRRVHGNVPLFAALTLATPGVSLAARAGWLLGAGALLSASHVAHVIASIHGRYALHNAGPYSCGQPSPEQLAQLSLPELWANPPALHRRVVLGLATAFNVVLQRVLPCALWLPLFLRGLRRRGAVTASTGPAADPVRRLARRYVATAALGVGLLLISTLVLARASRSVPPTSVEGVQLGMGVEAAQRVLNAEGYVWTTSPRPERHDCPGLVSTFVDVWPPLLFAQRGRPRYNWIGLRVTQPAGAPPMVGCITSIRTAPSETRPERHHLEGQISGQFNCAGAPPNP